MTNPTDTPDYTPLLDRGVQLRIQAKALEEESKAMKDEANKLFKVALGLSGGDKLTHDRGTITRTVTSRSTLDKEQLAQILVTKGIQADVVKNSIEEATSVKEVESITFREKKQ